MIGRGQQLPGLLLRRPGLGSYGDILYGSIIDTGLGTTADCAQWFQWMANMPCWMKSISQWQEFNAQTYPSPPPLPSPVAPTTEQQLTQLGAWTPDTAIQATVAAGKQQQQTFFTDLAANLAINAPGVDCKQFWNALVSPVCSFTNSSFFIPTLVVGGVLAFLLISRR